VRTVMFGRERFLTGQCANRAQCKALSFTDMGQGEGGADGADGASPAIVCPTS